MCASAISGHWFSAMVTARRIRSIATCRCTTTPNCATDVAPGGRLAMRWNGLTVRSGDVGGRSRELRVVEREVRAALCQQFPVVALLDDAAGVHLQNGVRVADRRQPVRDDEAGALRPEC